jgi:hypothetical protein
MEHPDESVEVSGPAGGEERFDDIALTSDIAIVRSRSRALHRPACSARELPGRGWGPPDQRGDLLERQVEHIVQHEGEALGGTQRFKHHEQREPNRIAEQRILFGVGLALAADHGVGHAKAGRLLGTGLSGLECVQAHARNDRG